MKYKIAIGGIMGVPVTFLDKYSNKMGEGYEIIGLTGSSIYIELSKCCAIINGRNMYRRILIRRKIQNN